MGLGRKVSPVRKEINKIDFRLEQVEMALTNLMHVVANQDEELDTFKKTMNEANKDTSIFTDLISMLSAEGGEA
jgi:hypothetical protein|tara:strand:- start:423 stop:644 length:222 start_codon:yes stop_codon:yes gene_type:complete